MNQKIKTPDPETLIDPGKDLKPATLAANAGGAIDPQTGGVVPPVQPSTTFVREADYSLLNPDFQYARDQNDTVMLAERLLSRLDHGTDALLFPSGMAAIAAVFRTVQNGGTVLLQNRIYWGTTCWVRAFCTRRDIRLHELDTTNNAVLEEACARLKPDLVFVETPSNPWLATVDLAFAAQCAQANDSLLAVDSTAATPVLTRPLDFGADIVIHSATKGINGHSDVLAGVLVTKEPDAMIWRQIKTDRHDAGAVLGAFEAWLLVRGMRTLPLRVERMSQNALAIAGFLNAHRQVGAVMYPGLESHEGHGRAVRQMTGGFGSLLSFRVTPGKDGAGGRETALAVAGRLNLFRRATSLGGVESLVEHRHTIEPDTGIPTDLLRLSVGIEDAGDLIADLEQALNG